MLSLRSLDSDQPSCEVTGQRLSVGRDSDNNVVIDDDSVSGFHAELFLGEGRLEVVDLGSTNGTWLDDQKVHQRQEVRVWQRLRFGAVTYEVVDDQSRRPTRQLPAASVSEPAISQEFAPSAEWAEPVRGHLDLEQSGKHPTRVGLCTLLTIGRDPENDLVLRSDQISSRHARLEWSDGGAVLTDLRSTNGTWVNSTRVQRQRLANGDRIAFDEIVYRFWQLDDHGRDGTRLNEGLGRASSQDVIPDRAVSSSKAAPPVKRSVPPYPHKKAAPVAGELHKQQYPADSPNRVQAADRRSEPQGSSTPRQSGSRFWPLVPLSRFAEFSGRSRRKEFWWYFLAYTLVCYGVMFIDTALGHYDPVRGKPGLLIWFVLLPLVLPTLSVQVRRLHDLDRSGWWMLLGLIPFIGTLVLIVMYALPGTRGTNRFGPDPMDT